MPLQSEASPRRTRGFWAHANGSHLVVTNGKGRLFIQTLLPRHPEVNLVSGSELYRYEGKDYPPERDRGNAPQCRIEISPSQPAMEDYFLHVLTATDTSQTDVEPATMQIDGNQVEITIGEARVSLMKLEMGGAIEMRGRFGRRMLTNQVTQR